MLDWQYIGSETKSGIVAAPSSPTDGYAVTTGKYNGVREIWLSVKGTNPGASSGKTADIIPWVYKVESRAGDGTLTKAWEALALQENIPLLGSETTAIAGQLMLLDCAEGLIERIYLEWPTAPGAEAIATLYGGIPLER